MRFDTRGKVGARGAGLEMTKMLTMMMFGPDNDNDQ